MDPAENCHVALLAFPFGTHAAPLLSLAKALAAAAAAPAGPSFSFVSSRRSVASLSASVSPSENIEFYVVDDGADDNGDGGIEARSAAADPEAEVRAFLEKTPGNYRKALGAAVEGRAGARVTCVVGDAFLSFGGELAADLGVRWVPLWTGGPCSLQAHLYTDVLRNEIPVGGKDDVLDVDLKFIPGLAGIRVRDLPEGIVAGDLDGAFATLLHRMAAELPRTAAAIALNSFEGLDPAIDAELASKFEKSLPIGPLNLLNPSPAEPDRFGCLAWLDKFKPDSVAYVSFGTVVGLPPTELAELALGLERSGVPFLWSLKEPARARLPVGFLDRTKDTGLVVPWVPQLAVLRRAAVGAFLTHCGWNSVLESATCGVPMVCRPFLGDQMTNAQVVSRVWKVGVRLESGLMAAADVANAVKRAVRDEEGKKMRERAAEIAKMANRAVGPDGRSVRNLKALLEIVMSK